MGGLIARHRSVFRFGLVGLLNTGIDVGLYLVMLSLGLPMYWANFVSTSVATACSFFLNRGYTFAAWEGPLWRQAVKFVATTGVSLWIIQPGVIALVQPILPEVAGLTQLYAAWQPLVAKLAGIAVGMVWNYVMYARFVFSQRRARA